MLDLGGPALEEGVLYTFLPHMQEVMESISKHKATMKHVLEDALLVALRLEGGTVLARLRREEPGASEDCQ